MSFQVQALQARPGLGFGCIGPSPIEWRDREHVKCMAANDFLAAADDADPIYAVGDLVRAVIPFEFYVPAIHMPRGLLGKFCKC